MAGRKRRFEGSEFERRFAQGPYFRCTACTFVTDDSPEYYKHTTEVHNFVCNRHPWLGCPVDGCDYTAASLETIVDHRNKSHREVRDGFWGVTSRFNVAEPIQCPCCTAPPYKNAFLFWSHAIACHGIEFKWDFNFACSQCTTRFFASHFGLLTHFKEDASCTGITSLTFAKRLKIEDIACNPALHLFVNPPNQRHEIDMD